MKRLWCLLAVLTAFATFPAKAEQWPAKPVHIVIGLSAGSAVDVVPRIVLQQVEAQTGGSFVVENRTGASGTIATRAVASAEPDGYTFLAHSSAFLSSPYLLKAAKYDPVKDFVAVSPLGNLPNVLIVSPSKNIKTVKEFVETAKSRRMTFGTAGTGTPVYLAMQKFRIAAGINGDFVPYRGAPEVVTEVVAGRIDAYYAPISSAIEFIRSGKVLALSVSSKQRALSLPDVPTSIEAGYPDSDLDLWIGVFAPAKTPHDIVARFNKEINKALASKEVREKLVKQGVGPMPMELDAFKKFVGEESAAMAKLAKTLDLKPI